MRLKPFVILLLITASAAMIMAQGPLWLRYPAVSPDGQRIVFEYQGDLFVASIDGGNARQLTTHPARDYLPAWSPDGTRIAFSSSRYGNDDVYVIPAEGGTPQRLTVNSAGDSVCGWTNDGTAVLFTSFRTPQAAYMGFPSPVMQQLYRVDLQGHRPVMVLQHGVARAVPSPDGKYLAYMDVKGYEDQWRKHHHSSVTRDIWLYDPAGDKFTQLTTYNGEDRDPVWAPDGNSLYYLSEESGSLNVWQMSVTNPADHHQITRHETNPVRFLSISRDGKELVYGFRGEIWRCDPATGKTSRISITIKNDRGFNNMIRDMVNSVSGNTALSPDGKEIAFIYRGEVFVTAADYSATKRITNTPEQERSVSWAPDGRSLIYASERNDSWNIYQTSIVREDEKHFYNATILKEKPILTTDRETFQPAWSPDGKLIAYLEERTTLKVLDPATGQTRTLLPADRNYSYSDGDISFKWSPDSRWITTEFLPGERWVTDIAVINVESGELHNITLSGYSNTAPYWSRDGKQLLFISDRNGLRSHGGHGAQFDVYAVYLTKADHDRYTKPESELADEETPDRNHKDKPAPKDGDQADKKAEASKAGKKVEPISIDFDGIRDRIRRLTINSSTGMNSDLSPDGKTLVYFASSAGKYDLWAVDTRKHTTRILLKLNANQPGQLEFSPDGKAVIITVNNRIQSVDPHSGKAKPIAIRADMEIDGFGERAYMFDHVWRQVLKKFYVKDLQGVDWTGMKTEYSRFLPYITNDADFAEMLSEMLGELNASHTGCRYRPRPEETDDATAALGLFFDPAYTGKGLKIVEVLKDGPFDTTECNVKSGQYLLAINGHEIAAGENYFPLLNHQAGQRMLAQVADTPDGQNSRDVVFKPVGAREMNNLLYDRWTRRCRAIVEKDSDGQIGYVHVRGMNPESFKEVYSEIFGRNLDKKALVVDTRFNGGGWLHDDLCTLLGGKVYVRFRPRGQKLGHEPQEKWTKPVVVVTGEANYSDAHMFPFAFRELKLGKIVGMPVPGTGTAVWWERLLDPSLIFGIPQVGMLDNRGHYLENQQLEPDIKVANDPAEISQGHDQQLDASVKELLREIK